ncbi:MAG: hypothetical protein AB7T49_17685 [Oligoflexales bacterium]
MVFSTLAELGPIRAVGFPEAPVSAVGYPKVKYRIKYGAAWYKGELGCDHPFIDATALVGCTLDSEDTGVSPEVIGLCFFRTDLALQLGWSLNIDVPDPYKPQAMVTAVNSLSPRFQSLIELICKIKEIRT